MALAPGRPGHAALYARKVLAARLALLRAFEGGEAMMGSAPEQLAALEAVRALMLAFRTSATGKLDGEAPRDESLDVFLKTLAEGPVAAARLAATVARHTELDRRLGLLQADLAGHDCVACAGAGGGHLCNANARDDVTVDQSGLCIREFKLLFEWARQLAVTAYEGFLPAAGATGAIALVFETAAKDDLRALPNLPPLQAGVEFERPGDALAAYVKLTFSPDEFDVGALPLCPYLLVHELVAHAFLAATGPRALRLPPFPEDGWAEGWMDCVAFIVLDRALWGEAPFQALPLPAWLDPVAVKAQAAAFHKARYLNPRFGYARQILTADRTAFYGLYGRFAATSVPGVSRVDVLLRAVLLINLLGAPAETTRRLMAAAKLADRARGSSPLTDAETRIFGALTRFLDERNPGTLATDLRF
jgi:hypothetical protein